MLQTNNSQSWTTLILLAALLLAFFPGFFHFLWRAPLSLLSLFAGHLFIDGMVQPSAAPAPAPAVTSWTQKTLTLPARARGSYLITDDVVAALPELQGYRVGLLNLFVQHTSCGLALNENCDVDVRLDMDDALDRIAPEDRSRGGLYRHAAEGPDDMPAHVKSALIGASVTIPITNGGLALGTWQGIWYLEFRRSKHLRTVVATIQGEKS